MRSSLICSTAPLSNRPPPSLLSATTCISHKRHQPRANVCTAYAHVPSRDFLLKTGISADAVAKATHRYPALLSVDVSTRLRPNIRLLKTVGLTIEDIQSIILRCPSVVSLDVEGKIRPVLEFLEEMGLDDAAKCAVIKKFPAVLTYGVKSHLRPHVAYLRSLGVDNSVLPDLILQRPSVLGTGIEVLVNHLLRSGFQRKQVRNVLRTYPFWYRVPVLGFSKDPSEAVPDRDA